MRAFILPLLLAALLLAPVALADGNDRGRDRSDLSRAHDDDHDDDDGDGEERRNRTSDRANRSAAREAWAENHTAMIDRVIAQLQSMRTSWHENATKVRDACHSFDRANATEEQIEDHRHCVRDGYRNWRTVNRAEIKELREEMRALLEGWHKTGRHDSD